MPRRKTRRAGTGNIRPMTISLAQSRFLSYKSYKEHIDLLPKGKALDIAMGEGRNGVFPATRGFHVTGLDISERGLKKATALAEAQRVGSKLKLLI